MACDAYGPLIRLPSSSARNFHVMVGVAQLVRAPDCGSGGRGFETRHSPHLLFPKSLQEERGSGECHFCPIVLLSVPRYWHGTSKMLVFRLFSGSFPPGTEILKVIGRLSLNYRKSQSLALPGKE